MTDSTYVNKLLEELKEEFKGSFTRITELEALRYLEDPIALSPEEKPSGLEVRLGATAELIENIKSALTANPPTIHFKPLREGDTAKENSSKREKFWNAYLKSMNRPVPILSETADAQAGLGIAILKGAYYPWPQKERRRNKGESEDDYKDRQKALKKLWGPPFKVVTVHPLTFRFRLGSGNEIVEAIEHSWKPKREIYAAYGIKADVSLTGKVPEERKAQISVAGGFPDEETQALPIGVSTSTLALVTEYWSPDEYQCYVNGQLVYEESPPSIRYFLAVGRTSSSKDPDKFGLSVAEILRQNEPTLNRSLTRLAEATELIVRKRNTLELGEGTVAPTEGETNEPRKWTFKPGEMEALPPGSNVVDVFSGAEAAYGAMPFIDLMLRLLGEHGVSPIFKGIPPGAAGSGYRDNSLYLMARSQFQYLLDSYSGSLSELIRWLESLIVSHASQEVFVDELSLVPKDIKDFPAVIEVTVKPYLPQNIIAEGQFYDRMHERGHITRRYVQETGLRIEQPEEMTYDRKLEDMQEMLWPILVQDVLEGVGVLPKQPTGLVGPDGKPLENPMAPKGGPGGVQQLMAQMRGDGQGAAGQAMGGYTRAGQARQPPEEAGTLEGA